ncbi:hypothetical protein VST63_16710 [Mycolicibacterium sp. 050232]|uniref:hypothetical protein n=1 Tax=Mycolicibacterium sp. 050232 TaxID=3113982 RepID=UPI002E2CBE27|nr:hypothetical protein [Mycolicibacterium sp. 050232]MED5814003.1 hypothetical protein [Mycolicibacterium sp. 050232]
MALVSAAICPHPVMLIPDLAGRSDRWDRLRSACLEAVGLLQIPVVGGGLEPSPDAPQLVAIVGGDDATRSFDPAGAYPSLFSNGIRWRSGWGQDAEDPQPLPLTLSLGYWLLVSSRPDGKGIIVADGAFESIDFDASLEDCAALGRDLAGRAERVAMIVIGEGSTCMTASDRVDQAEEAAGYDKAVMRALEQCDADALGRLGENGLAMTGRAPWRVLAGAAAGNEFEGRLHAGGRENDGGYFVASWTRRPSGANV